MTEMNQINGRECKLKDTYKWPTGFPPIAGVGQANQMIPLAAHLRSTFLSMLTQLFPSDEMFLQT